MPTSPAAAAAWLRQQTVQRPWAKPLLFALALLPLLQLLWQAASGGLGPDPEHEVIVQSGRWTLRLLLATLAVTPLRQLSGWVELARWRRMLGLFAFTYACLHFSAYFGLANGFSVDSVLADARKNLFVLLGLAALLLMLPLAATSSHAATRRLGGARWRALHRLVYAVAVLGVWHAWWGKLAKNHTGEPKLYALILALLLLWRLLRPLRSPRD